MNLALIRRGVFDRLPGECWHLWHDESGWRGATEESKAKHRTLMREYADDVAEFVANKGWKTPAHRKQYEHAQGVPPGLVPGRRPTSSRRSSRVSGRSSQELHPDWDFITHDDPDEVAKWLTNKALFQRVREAAEADPAATTSYGSLPDIVRYEFCNKFGGVYIDVDFEPLKPFDDRSLKDTPFIAWESIHVVYRVLRRPPGHPAFADLVENLPAHAARRLGRTARPLATGPEFITERGSNAPTSCASRLRRSTRSVGTSATASAVPTPRKPSRSTTGLAAGEVTLSEAQADVEKLVVVWSRGAVATLIGSTPGRQVASPLGSASASPSFSADSPGPKLQPRRRDQRGRTARRRLGRGDHRGRRHMGQRRRLSNRCPCRDEAAWRGGAVDRPPQAQS